MIRTQVYLQDDQYERIIALAKASGMPMAEIIRTSIAKGLIKKRKNNLAGISKLKLRGGPKNLSSKLDEYLYQ